MINGGYPETPDAWIERHPIMDEPDPDICPECHCRDDECVCEPETDSVCSSDATEGNTLKGQAKPMMKCGHAANATNMKTGAPSCAICAGLTPDADVIESDPKRFDLTGRVAVCPYCKTEQPSHTGLPFFEYGHFGKPAAK